ncbi:MAG: glutamyl-tRNA reductase [Verrucomicrobiota bacterium]
MSEALQSLFVLGSTHREAPIELREQFALESKEVVALQKEMLELPHIKECLIVNTCNRLEVYGLADSPEVEDLVRNQLCEHNGINRTLFDSHSFWRTNLDVLQHALEVSSGIDSQMVGETEILGQMKGAYAVAKDNHCTGIVLNRLFEKSFQAAKSARTQTGITRGQVSIGNIVVDLASRIFGKITRSRVLLLGSGEVGESTAQALKSRGVSDITVSSRTFENAHALAHGLGGAAIEFEDFQAQLPNFDIVISSTAAPGSILTKKVVGGIIKKRREEPLFIIDLALPRDIDPEVNTLDNVYLYNLDDLSKIANENLKQRRIEIERARAILKSYAWTLWLQLRRRTLVKK